MQQTFYQFLKAYYNDILELYFFVEGVWTRCSNDLTFNLVSKLNTGSFI